MKKVIFLGAFLSLFGLEALAQSTFFLRNINPFSNIDAPVFDAEGNRLAGTNYAVELWGGSSSDSLAATLDFDTHQRLFLNFGTGMTAGYFASVAQMTVFAVPGNGFAWVQVRAWETRLGTTWEEVAAIGMGGYGESSLLYIMGGDPNGVPPTTPRPLIGLQSFSLRPIPEPAVWQLGVIGFASLLLVRQKTGRTKSYENKSHSCD